jgi:cellulose synthase/poly-beta-1,6-N-acetylglucosamine synthase-like glycosyltransferase
MRSLTDLDYPKDRYEVIVVDARSRDKTPEIAVRYGARVLVDEGKGRSIALNLGVQFSKGDYVAFTDADCSPERSWLRRLLEHFSSQEVAGVGGPNIVPKEGNPFSRAVEFVSLQSPYAKKFDAEGEVETIAGCNSMYDAEILKKFMPLPQIGYYEDTLLNYRIRKAGFKILSAPNAIVWHYRHYSGPRSFFRQMLMQGAGEIQGTRLERGLKNTLHRLEGFSVPLFVVVFLFLLFVGVKALIAFLLFVVCVLAILSVRCLIETRSFRVTSWVPLVAIIEGAGYSSGFIKEILRSRGGDEPR